MNSLSFVTINTRNNTEMTNNELDTIVLDAIASFKNIMQDNIYNKLKQEYGDFITESDKISIRADVDSFFENQNYTFENMKRDILIGLDNGYSIEQQIEMMKLVLKE